MFIQCQALSYKIESYRIENIVITRLYSEVLGVKLLLTNILIEVQIDAKELAVVFFIFGFVLHLRNITVFTDV